MKRIWCEFLPPEKLMKPWLVKALWEYDVMLNYKVEYGKIDENLFSMLYYFNKNNVGVNLWFTLSDEDGYWINEQNCEKFYQYVYSNLEVMEKKNIKINGLCIDLEPPLAFTRKIILPRFFYERFLGLIEILTKNLNPFRYHKSVRIFSELASFLKEKNIESMGVATRHLYYDLKYKMSFLQNALETPLFDVPWDRYNLMYYSTLIKQQFPKISPEKLNQFIYNQVKFAREELGDKFAVSVGCTNEGKLGHEAYYSNPKELKKDMEIFKSCGVKDFSLFSLDGLLEEKKLRSFLEVF